MALIFIALPVAIYLSLALLPRGRPAAMGIVVAALFALALWTLSDPASDEGFGRVIAAVAASGIGLAALVQGLRALLGPGQPVWLYPAMVTLALPLALGALLVLLGAGG